MVEEIESENIKSILPLETKNLDLTKFIAKPKKWTSETPNLYQILILLKDQNGNIVDVTENKIDSGKLKLMDSNY